MRKVTNDDETEYGWQDTATPWGFGQIATLTDSGAETVKEKKIRLQSLKIKMPFIGFYPNE